MLEKIEKMPRRKKARKNQTSRMRPVLPEGDLDSSMSIDERKAKLDIYLKDLNMQGTDIVKLTVLFFDEYVVNLLIIQLKTIF